MFSSFNQFFGKTSTRRRSGFRPQLDNLENRVTPSTVVFPTGSHTLNIIGDNHANTVDIQQDDSNNDLTIVADGHTFSFNSDQFSKINIALNGGNDHLSYELQSDFTNAKLLNIDLGKGNDQANLDFFDNGNIHADLFIKLQAGSGNDNLTASFGQVEDAHVNLFAAMGDGKDDATINLFGDLTGTARVDVNVDGGDGNDRITFNANEDDVNNDGTGIDISADAQLNVALSGGKGNDTIDATYEGELDGTFSFQADGGKGNDTIDAEITLDSASSGSLHAFVRGKDGNDDLTLNVTDNSGGTASVDATVDGGSGHDTCVATSNVDVFHCEA
jgi:hypothetical protein